MYSIKRVWESYRLLKGQGNSGGTATAGDATRKGSGRGSSFTRKIYQNAKELSDSADELDSYLALGRENIADDDVALYWKVNAGKWKCLSKMAKDFLAIPATSASSERSFRTGRDLLGLNRQSMHSNTMEACICLRSWFRAGLITVEDVSREEVEQVLREEMEMGDGEQVPDLLD